MFKTTKFFPGPCRPGVPWQVAWSTEHADHLLLLRLHGGFRHRLMLSGEVWFQEPLLDGDRLPLR